MGRQKTWLSLPTPLIFSDANQTSSRRGAVNTGLPKATEQALLQSWLILEMRMLNYLTPGS